MDATSFKVNSLNYKLAELNLANYGVQEIAHISSQTDGNVEVLPVGSGRLEREKDAGNYVQNILSSQNNKPLLPTKGNTQDQDIHAANEIDFIHKPKEGKQNVVNTLFGNENKFQDSGRKNVRKSLDNDFERLSHQCENDEVSLVKMDLGSSKVSNTRGPSEREISRFRNLFDDEEAIDIEGVVVDNTLVQNIISQVEYYFSDFNLLKNNFILKCIKKNEDGFVSLRMISTFRKIRLLTKDIRVVANSLMKSENLDLNDKKSKIRRKEPVPKIRDTYLGKSIVAFNLPSMCQNDDNLNDLFLKFGNIVKAEIMTTKSSSYHVYHRRCLFRNNEFSCKNFGVVEFERYPHAVKALKDNDRYIQKENRMKVVPLTIQIHKNVNRRLRNYRSSNSRANRLEKELQQERRSPLKENDEGAIEDMQGRANKAERGYKRYSNRQYSRKRAPFIDDKSKRAEMKLSPEDPVCCEMRRSYNRSRQIRASNTVNASKPLNRNRNAFENA